MEKKELIKVKENIFAKIANFFKGLFSKGKEETVVTEENSNVKEEISLKETKSKDNKKEFFKLYNQVKEGSVDLYSIDAYTLKRIERLMEEEVRMKEEHLENIKAELKIHKKNLEKLRKETIGENT